LTQSGGRAIQGPKSTSFVLRVGQCLNQKVVLNYYFLMISSKYFFTPESFRDEIFEVIFLFIGNFFAECIQVFPPVKSKKPSIFTAISTPPLKSAEISSALCSA